VRVGAFQNIALQ